MVAIIASISLLSATPGRHADSLIILLIPQPTTRGPHHSIICYHLGSRRAGGVDTRHHITDTRGPTRSTSMSTHHLFIAASTHELCKNGGSIHRFLIGLDTRTLTDVIDPRLGSVVIGSNFHRSSTTFLSVTTRADEVGGVIITSLSSVTSTVTTRRHMSTHHHSVDQLRASLSSLGPRPSALDLAGDSSMTQR